MDRSERLALQYLERLGLGPVVFEPNGNVTPDFLVDGRIAVEVRRLNQNFEYEGRFEGLEVVEAALSRFIEKLLPTFGPPLNGMSWWVLYDYSRPLDLKPLKAKIRRALSDIQHSLSGDEVHINVAPGFNLQFNPASIPLDHFYELGAYDDLEAGGFVASEIIRNLKLCIEDKAKKTEPFRAAYSEWWLVLPDHIGPRLNADERSGLVGSVSKGPFSKVILLDPDDLNRALEI